MPPILYAAALAASLMLDGRLDEAIYSEATPFSSFTQYEPANGQPATERSDAWVFYDRDNLYIAVRNWDSQPGRMVANELRRDATTLTQNEQITVTLDTFHDRRNGFVFLVNALGGMLDEAITDERNPSRDWNAVWDAKVARFEGGWSVEMRIPFRSLRYNAAPKPAPAGDGGPTWGIQIGRSIRWKNEITFVAPLPVLAGPPVYRVSYAATLAGLELPPLPLVPDVKVWGKAGTTTDRAAVGTSLDRTADAGFDLRHTFARGLTADVTVNTDFAQVEEDEQQINLTRFNLFFPEKREFFLEGQGILNFGGQGAAAASDVPIMFFSRTIGFARGVPQDILAGGRLTGRVGPYTVGALNVQTRDVAASGAAGFNASVIRVRRDILQNSTVGLLLSDRSQAERGEGRNVFAGVDGVFTFMQYLRVNTYAARTSTRGLGSDDWSYRGQVEYSGDRYGAAAERLRVGADFNPEAGFVRRVGFSRSNVTFRFSPRPRGDGPLRRVRKFSYEGGYSYFERAEGGVDSFEASALARVEFQSGDNAQVQFLRSHDRVPAPFPLAPGVNVQAGRYDWQSVLASYVIAARRRVAGTITAQAGSFYGGTQRAAGYRGRVALATHLAIEPSVSVNRVELPHGHFTSTLISARATMPMTPRMFTSVLLQYNSLAAGYSASARLRWEYRPGSELFIVFTEGRDTRTAGFPSLLTRGLAVKVTRTFTN